MRRSPISRTAKAARSARRAGGAIGSPALSSTPSHGSSYFSAQNRHFSGLWPTRRTRQDPPEAGRRVLKNLIDNGGRRLRCSPLFHGTADVDDVVGDHAEPDPTLHTGIAPVMASVETVAPLADADASLAAGPPLLAVAEPALPLLTL